MKVRDDDWDLCADMECPHIFRKDDCVPSNCKQFNERMQMVGSIYMIMPDDSAGFVGRLPSRDPRQVATSPNRAANSDKILFPYPARSELFPLL